MRKELEEVKQVLTQIYEGDWRYIEGSDMYLDLSKALATLDRILGQDEPEMVQLVMGIVEHVQEVVEKYTLSADMDGNPLAVDFHRFEPEEMAIAALRALGLLKEGGA